MAEMPVIEPQKCNGCGLCITVCKCGALGIVDNVITIVKTLSTIPRAPHLHTVMQMRCPGDSR